MLALVALCGGRLGSECVKLVSSHSHPRLFSNGRLLCIHRSRRTKQGKQARRGLSLLFVVTTTPRHIILMALQPWVLVVGRARCCLAHRCLPAMA